jgi:hypothetical protein
MRDADLAISSYLLRRLRAAADILELPNAESVAELFLEERLKNMPEVDELIREQKAASIKIREQWRAKQRQVSEALPPTAEFS